MSRVTRSKIIFRPRTGAKLSAQSAQVKLSSQQLSQSVAHARLKLKSQVALTLSHSVAGQSVGQVETRNSQHPLRAVTAMVAAPALLAVTAPRSQSPRWLVSESASSASACRQPHPTGDRPRAAMHLSPTEAAPPTGVVHPVDRTRVRHSIPLPTSHPSPALPPESSRARPYCTTPPPPPPPPASFPPPPFRRRRSSQPRDAQAAAAASSS